MIKNVFSIILFTIFLFILIRQLADKGLFNIEASASPIPTVTSTQNIKDQLINIIASRVAELKLVEKRGIIGEVSDVSNTQITLSDIQNNTRFVDVDELTKFSSPLTKSSFGISDITKGTRLGILGLYNKESRRLLARFVNVVELPMFIHGAVDSIDSQNYTLNITTSEGKKMTMDVETSTKILSYTKTSGLIRSGFSKIKENEDVIIVGFTNIKNKDKVIAGRIILFPELLSTTNFKETISSPSGSGKKVAPITR